MLSQERLKQVFNYDPHKGTFTRKMKQPGVACGAISGSRNNEGYLVTSVDGKIYKCHRLAWFYMTGQWPEGQIDHINGVKDDNRFENLRDVTKNTNLQNQRKAQRSNKSTGVLGTFKMGNKFAARITHDGKKTYLGVYATLEEAHAAYLGAKRLLHKGCTL